MTKKKPVVESYTMTPAIESQLRQIVAYKSLDFVITSLVKSFGLEKVCGALNKLIYRLDKSKNKPTDVIVYDNPN